MIDPELIPLVAQRFKALGEPARLTLLAALQQGEKSVSELVEETGRTQPNVSQHLKEMARAGLVQARRQGSRVFYRVADPYVNRICDAVCRSVREARGPGAPWPQRHAKRSPRARASARRERAIPSRAASEGHRG